MRYFVVLPDPDPLTDNAERLNEQHEEIERRRQQREDEIEEFNAGREAARNGEPIDNDPSPPEDHWRIGWCAFHGDRQVKEFERRVSGE